LQQPFCTRVAVSDVTHATTIEVL